MPYVKLKTSHKQQQNRRWVRGGQMREGRKGEGAGVRARRQTPTYDLGPLDQETPRFLNSSNLRFARLREEGRKKSSQRRVLRSTPHAATCKKEVEGKRSALATCLGKGRVSLPMGAPHEHGAATAEKKLPSGDKKKKGGGEKKQRQNRSAGLYTFRI